MGAESPYDNDGLSKVAKSIKGPSRFEQASVGGGSLSSDVVYQTADGEVVNHDAHFGAPEAGVMNGGSKSIVPHETRRGVWRVLSLDKDITT